MQHSKAGTRLQENLSGDCTPLLFTLLTNGQDLMACSQHVKNMEEECLNLLPRLPSKTNFSSPPCHAAKSQVLPNQFPQTNLPTCRKIYGFIVNFGINEAHHDLPVTTHECIGMGFPSVGFPRLSGTGGQPPPWDNVCTVLHGPITILLETILPKESFFLELHNMSGTANHVLELHGMSGTAI